MLSKYKYLKWFIAFGPAFSDKNYQEGFQWDLRIVHSKCILHLSLSHVLNPNGVFQNHLKSH